MGTPQFSCPTLEALIEDPQFEIGAIYSKEPQIAKRGQKIINSPIHNLALKHNLKIITPKTLKDQEIQKEFYDLNADLAVVVAYGLILPKEILNATKWGCINIHPSLLPKWRGAAPIQRTIMNGDIKTAITIMKMDQGLDSGDIIYQEEFPLDNNITYQQLANHMSIKGAEILIKTLKKIATNDFTLTKQDDIQATYAKKIEKTECKINWNLSAIEIDRQIRGLSGCLEAYFEYKNEKIKIYQAEIINEDISADSLNIIPGSIVNDNFIIQCQKGQIKPILLQRESKKVIYIDEFLRGFKF
jgi:methionyl-tRNA formyltransferase